MELEQLECRGASPHGSQDSYLCPVGRGRLHVQLGDGVGPLAYRAEPRLLCAHVGNQLSLVFVHTYVYSSQGTGHVSGSPICIYAGLHRSRQQMLWGGES